MTCKRLDQRLTNEELYRNQTLATGVTAGLSVGIGLVTVTSLVASLVERIERLAVVVQDPQLLPEGVSFDSARQILEYMNDVGMDYSITTALGALATGVVGGAAVYSAGMAKRRLARLQAQDIADAMSKPDYIHSVEGE